MQMVTIRKLMGYINITSQRRPLPLSLIKERNIDAVGGITFTRKRTVLSMYTPNKGTLKLMR